MVPNVQVGDKLIKDDTIIYNSSFFIKDIFNPKRVMYAPFTYVNVCLTDIPETVEDSSMISKDIVDTLSTNNTKVKSIILDADKDIPFIVSVGDKVNNEDAIMTYIDKSLEDVDLDKASLSILKDLKKASPKAKVKGEIVKIEVFYNGELKDFSKNVRKIIEESDKGLLERTGYTGQVDNTYSVKGKPLLEKSMEIKIYIETNMKMSIGDKCVFGNQIKSVVGGVYKNDILTEDNRKVDALFGYTSIEARIVNSPYILGTTATLLDWVAEEAVNAYFNKK